jgi:hypothetical protein
MVDGGRCVEIIDSFRSKGYASTITQDDQGWARMDTSELDSFQALASWEKTQSKLLRQTCICSYVNSHGQLYTEGRLPMNAGAAALSGGSSPLGEG